MESFATPYPVIFFDGETERDAGCIGVHSVLTFKRFQSLMSQKTGLSVNQLSAVFVCRRTVNDVEKKQKLPINENTNFCIILNQHNPSRERDAHFLISVKKSKKDRKGGATGKKKTAEEEEEEEALQDALADPTPVQDPKPPVIKPVPPVLTPAPSPQASAAAQREAAQRERERLNIALGRSQPTPEVKGLRREQPPLSFSGSTGRPAAPAAGNVAGNPAAIQNGSRGPGTAHLGGSGLSSQSSQHPAGATGSAPPNAALSMGVSVTGPTTLPQGAPRGGFPGPAGLSSGPLGASPSNGAQFGGGGEPNDAVQAGEPARGNEPSRDLGSDSAGGSMGLGLEMGIGLGGVTGGARRAGIAGSIGASAEAGAEAKGPSGGSASSRAGPERERPVALDSVQLEPEPPKSCKFCAFCRDRARAPPFHWCVDDRVVVGFRGPSPAGPICRAVASSAVQSVA
ncbi:hypothetical protein CYMTET_44149 [Cymbomonas tetramitiformis]|uniref:DUF7138 domain-containing protein n=1 Tax=Cymbomonas tetramitiformis TaxID=36881 RepID=A0AAE0F103_9CHLO|nr:hypothetical protein CYMTET_46970 [Cymbomonas tetramitiformis]KAK3246310.1 hypothetical protein CYMTET_44149 [Cymbomonas tetramitiformis]